MRNEKLNERTGLIGHLIIKTYKNGELIRQTAPMRNKVVTSNGYGRNLVARAMAGDPTYPIVIDSAAVGDDNTAAADGDTDLGNALVSDIDIANSIATDNVLNIDVFAPDAELPDDTYEEFGLFANGRLISRVIISPAYTKGSGEDTLFSYELEFTG